MNEESHNRIMISSLHRDGVRFAIRDDSGEVQTYFITREDARAISLEDSVTKHSHNFCPECGTRCQFCPECGERLR